MTLAELLAEPMVRIHLPPDRVHVREAAQYRQHQAPSAGAGVGPRFRSVDNDDDARWLVQRLHRSFGSSVDVNPGFLGWPLLVIGAGPVELSIAQHNAALGENGTLQFCDSLGIGPIR
jgi:hypothetical protein